MLGELEWKHWIEDSFLCRYGGQDIFKLRGLNRPLTVRESLLFRAALDLHMKKEFAVRPEDGASA